MSDEMTKIDERDESDNGRQNNQNGERQKKNDPKKPALLRRL